MSMGTIGDLVKPPEKQHFQLRLYPDEVLKQRATDIPAGEDLQSLIESMVEVLRFYRGAGLAAQQVGSTQRICLMMLAKRDKEGKVIRSMSGTLTESVVCINPRIISWSQKVNVSSQEGCLSAQNARTGEVFRTSKRRYDSVTLTYQDWDQYRSGSGKQHLRNLTGFDAIVAQHELDHLNGICIVDGLPRQQRKQLHRLMELV